MVRWQVFLSGQVWSDAWLRFWTTFRAGIYLEFHLSHSEGFLGATFIFRSKMLKNRFIFFSTFFRFFFCWRVVKCRTGRSSSDAPGSWSFHSISKQKISIKYSSIPSLEFLKHVCKKFLKSVLWFVINMTYAEKRAWMGFWNVLFVY